MELITQTCKTTLIVLTAILVSGACFGQTKVNAAAITNHPRLLLREGQENEIKTSITKNPAWRDVHESIITECDAILLKDPVTHTLIGRRLLDQSREAFRRVFYLAYAWRITGKKSYFKRCEEEMLAVSKFADWNPAHFLDAAEMTMAVSIGYDWLYNDLSLKSREIISRAIIDKGLKPSLDPQYNGWLQGQNNWNQVCNSGITFGAIAVYESQPKQSLELIDRALGSIPNSMKVYAPEGNYPEGYNYWGYGTTFNVLLISALENLFHNDYGLSNEPGFLNTGSFYENLTGPSGLPFNYSDSSGPDALQPAMFWFARKTGDPSLLYVEKQNLAKRNYYAKGNRFLPAALIWGHSLNMAKVQPPSVLAWFGHGQNSLALMRTSWNEPNNIFAGLKGGTPSAGHGHMDVGSFVMESEGVRWSDDLGMQQYESLESKGLKIWDMSQQSQRWQVFRYSNFAHSTLTVNGNLQLADGNAPLITTSADSLFTRAVVDLKSLYRNDLVNAKRGIAILNKQYVTIRDEVETGPKECVIRWVMLTRANVSAVNDNQMELSTKGKKLMLYVAGLPGIKWQTWRTDPPNSYDALNLGTTLVGFEIKIPANTKKEFNVILLPGTKTIAIQRSALKPLNEW